MKSFVVLGVALIMLIKPLWPIVDYIANYDYIVDVLCENRARPAMNCNGKCYLAKQLAKAAGNEKNPFEEKRSKTENVQVVFIQALPQIVIGNLFFVFKRSLILSNKELISKLLIIDISQPPETARLF